MLLSGGKSGQTDQKPHQCLHPPWDEEGPEIPPMSRSKACHLNTTLNTQRHDRPTNFPQHDLNHAPEEAGQYFHEHG